MAECMVCLEKVYNGGVLGFRFVIMGVQGLGCRVQGADL